MFHLIQGAPGKPGNKGPQGLKGGMGGVGLPGLIGDRGDAGPQVRRFHLSVSDTPLKCHTCVINVHSFAF